MRNHNDTLDEKRNVWIGQDRTRWGSSLSVNVHNGFGDHDWVHLFRAQRMHIWLM